MALQKPTRERNCRAPHQSTQLPETVEGLRIEAPLLPLGSPVSKLNQLPHSPLGLTRFHQTTAGVGRYACRPVVGERCRLASLDIAHGVIAGLLLRPSEVLKLQLGIGFLDALLLFDD